LRLAQPPAQDDLVATNRAAEAASRAGPVRSVTVLSGAGISTDSGIPDFRGPQGVWTCNPGAERLATYQHYVAYPDVRRRSWQNRLGHPAWSAEPNAAHLALARLPGGGIDTWIVTQNIDGLHQKAGSPADRVIELHGTMFGVVCVGCGDRSEMAGALARVRAGEEDPACARCGGVLKSATVMFGQALDPDVFAAAVAASQAADVFIAVGSSLTVEPAASLCVLAADAGARLIIVNADPTPYDRLAADVIRDPIGQAIPALVDGLLGPLTTALP
jgi:NAD-dependent deacetylase